jgi:hypothetical protein
METEQEVQNAREKLAARFGNATQIGGKGKSGYTPAPFRSNDESLIIILIFRHNDNIH